MRYFTLIVHSATDDFLLTSTATAAAVLFVISAAYRN